MTELSWCVQTAHSMTGDVIVIAAALNVEHEWSADSEDHLQKTLFSLWAEFSG